MTESTEPRPPEGMQFNAPPGWPPPPPGWVPSADFQPDPSWPTAPADWQWWVPVRDPAEGSNEATAILPGPGGPQSSPSPTPPAPDPASHPGPDFEPGPRPAAGPDVTAGASSPAGPGHPSAPPVHASPDDTAGPAHTAGPDYTAGPHYTAGPDYTAGPSTPSTPPGAAGQQGSWVRRHRLLSAALVVVALLTLGGVGTAGAVLLANRGDDKPNSVAKTPEPQVSSSLPAPSPQPSGSPSAEPGSADHKAACDKAAAPNNRAIALVKGYTTKSMTNPAIIAAIPPVQADLTSAANSTTGVLQRDLREYAAAMGSFRTALIRDRDGNTAAAKVLIYSIVLKAECGY